MTAQSRPGASLRETAQRLGDEAIQLAEALIAHWLGMEIPEAKPAPAPRPIRSARSAAGAKRDSRHAPGGKRAVVQGGKIKKPPVKG